MNPREYFSPVDVKHLPHFQQLRYLDTKDNDVYVSLFAVNSQVKDLGV